MAERNWTQPPVGEKPESLWPALQDGVVLGFSSDRLSREARFRVELGFPTPPEPCPDEVEIVFTGVTHILVTVSRGSPEPSPHLVTPITDEMRVAEEAYRRKGRAESVGLEAFVATIPEGLEIINASLGRTPEGLTFTIDGPSPDVLLGDW